MKWRNVAAFIAGLAVIFPALGPTSYPADTTGNPRACELVDLALAVQVVGPDAVMIGDDSDPESCMYVVPGRAVLTIQLWSAEGYDQILLGGPHTPVDIGDRARRSIDTAESVTVQFVKGDYSVTMTASNIAGATASFLDPLLAAARVVEQRMP